MRVRLFAKELLWRQTVNKKASVMPSKRPVGRVGSAANEHAQWRLAWFGNDPRRAQQMANKADRGNHENRNRRKH